MPNVELVVTDLDGTFWHTDDHVPMPVLDAVAELSRRSIPLLVATGRRLASTRGPLALHGLAPPAIVLNGALGVDLATGDRFHLAPFAADEALAAYDAFASVGLSPVVYIDDPRHDVFLSRAPDTNPEHVRDLGDTAGIVPDLRKAMADAQVLGFSLIGVPFDRAQAAADVLDGIVEVHLDRSFDFHGMASLTAAPRHQSKWDGVLSFCSSNGLDSTKVMAVADGPNDIELLGHAAIRVVPEVAHQSALDLATHRIPSARDGGWAGIIALLD